MDLTPMDLTPAQMLRAYDLATEIGTAYLTSGDDIDRPGAASTAMVHAGRAAIIDAAAEGLLGQVAEMLAARLAAVVMAFAGSVDMAPGDMWAQTVAQLDPVREGWVDG